MPQTLKEILADPNFQGLQDAEEKRKYLTIKIPGFSSLPHLEQNKVFGYQEFPLTGYTPPKPSFGQRMLTEAGQEAIGLGRTAATLERGLAEAGTLGGSERFMPPQEQAVRQKLETATTPGQERGKFLGEMGAYAAAPELGIEAKAPLALRMAIEAAKTGFTGGALSRFDPAQTATAAALGAAGPVLGATARGIGNVAMDQLGLITGTGPYVIRTAFENAGPRFMEAFTGGKAEQETVQDTLGALKKVIDERKATYLQQKARLPLQQRLSGAVTGVKGELTRTLQDFGIKTRPPRSILQPDGRWVNIPRQWDFSNTSLGDATHQAQVRKLMETLDGWTDNSLEGLDRLKQNIQNMYKTLRAPGEATPVQSLVQKAKVNLIKRINRAFPDYADMERQYAEKSEFIRKFNEEFSTKGALGKTPDGTMIRKLQNALNQNNDIRKDLLTSLFERTGVDIRQDVAGRALSSRVPRGLVARRGLRLALDFLPAIVGGAATGLRGAEEGAAATLAAEGAFMALSSPRVTGHLMVLLSEIERNPATRAMFQLGRGETVAGATRLVQPQPQPQQPQQ